MNANEQLISSFYTAFQKLDHRKMVACYSDDIVFFDPVFGLLKGDAARAMSKLGIGISEPERQRGWQANSSLALGL